MKLLKVCGILGLMLLAILLTYSFENSAISSSRLNGSSPRPLELARPTTLLETWDIVSSYSQLQTSHFSIGEISTIDHPSDSHSESAKLGTDGRRRAWFATISDKENARLMRLTIWDGEVVDQSEQPSSVESYFSLDKPVIDTPRAYLTATGSYSSLRPNGNYGQGFHFTLGATPEGNHFLAIIGGKQEEGITNDALVELNPLTGEMIKTRVRSYAQAGGILFSLDSGASWQASTLSGQMTTAATFDPFHPEWGYATTTNEKQITVYRTTDGGATWSVLSHLPPKAGSWPTSITAVPTDDTSSQSTILVTSRNGAWLSEDAQTWHQVVGLPQTPIQWSAVAYSKQKYKVLVSVIDGPERSKGLFVSSNLTAWNQVEEGFYRLSRSYDHSQVMAIEQTTGKAWRFTSTHQEKLELPLLAMEVAGDLSDHKRAIYRTSEAVGRFSGTEFKRATTIDLGVIATGPAFRENNHLIGGGFRTGIYLSPDGGQNWSLVLPNPSSLILGSNEIYDVIFLSETSVIAINGGMLEWSNLP